MTMERNGAVARNFVTAVLPWLVGAGGLLVYLMTLNPWISFLNLGAVTQVSGWSWQKEVGQPLTFAVLFPFRWLPERTIPLALNLFTAVCAALVLVLLARSVALLPHDLAPDEPGRSRNKPVSILRTPTAWMPPVLTAILCGLQLTFWEHATSASGAMIDLLVFAYVVRCLLEFGIDRDRSWIWRCALVYGAGMANNWALVGYAPVFLAAVLRAHGLRRSLDPRFLLRLGCWGSAGLSLYLLLPVVYSFSSLDQSNFWISLKLHLKAQMQALAAMRTPWIWVLVIASLLLLLIISVRWNPHTVQTGDDTPLGVSLTKTMGHLVYGLFLVISLWIGLDPAFSPRHLHPGMPMLTCYYLSALVFGYCLGYFLLLGSGASLKWFSRLPVIAGWILVFGLPLTLLWRNLNQIDITNGPAVHEFARQLYADLPPGRSVVLSEDGRPLALLRGELSAHGHEKEPILLNTALLPMVRYHVFMASRFKSRWPPHPPRREAGLLRPLQMRAWISEFAAREPIVYLHPSSGLLVEPFAVQPNGLVQHLVPRQGQEALHETFSDEIVAANEQIWTRRWTTGLKTLADDAEERPHPASPRRQQLLRFGGLTRERNFTASFLGAAYSKSLDSWGVAMQRTGHWAEAGVWFERALELNPENLSAQINRLYNQQYRRGDHAQLDPERVEMQFRDLFPKYQDWAEVISVGGPVDEPTFLFMTAQVLLPGRNPRQANQVLMRCSELAPDWSIPKLWLARSYIREGDFDKALEVTDEFRTPGQQLGKPGLADVLYCRAKALWKLGQTNEPAASIQDFVSTYPENDEVLAAAASLYAESLQFEQELKLLEELLRRDPNQVEWLARKGLAQLQLSRFDSAVATLSKALSLAPSDGQARLHRAIAHLGAHQLEAARDDYQELLKTSGYKRLALFGLGEVAWREKDTNSAIQFYQEFLSNGYPRSVRCVIAAERLKRLTARQVGGPQNGAGPGRLLRQPPGSSPPGSNAEARTPR
jgi:tetratricopeptide (TPR) repeat protein